MKKRLFYFRLYLRLLSRSKLWYDSPSYFPELINRRKSKAQIIIDQLSNFIRYGCLENFYFCYGHDIKGMHNQEEYVVYLNYFLRREKLNSQTSVARDTEILRNKLLFYCYASAIGIPSPRVIGTIQNGNLRPLYSGKSANLFEWINSQKKPFRGFAKVIDGECGKGVYAISTNEDGEVLINEKVVDEAYIKKSFNSGIFVLQLAISNQHTAISDLHKESINTVRIVTYRTKDGIYKVLPPVLRIGVGNSHVDNWAAGGIIVGIDEETCTLKKYGFFKPGYGGKIDHHPDSDIRFEGYAVPFLKEAITSAISFHESLPKVRAIGWDVALTTEGPLFIEGNDNWDLSLIQTCSHGLKKEFREIYY